jgi:hypothetical protein
MLITITISLRNFEGLYARRMKNNRLMMFRIIIAVYSENHTNPTNIPCWQLQICFILKYVANTDPTVV